MTEFLLRCRIESGGVSGNDGGNKNVWITRLSRLDDGNLNRLMPVLGGTLSVDTLRIAISMLPALVAPERALRAIFAKERGAFLQSAFQLHVLADSLRQLDTSDKIDIETLDAWCRRYLESEAANDADFAVRLAHWCHRMMIRHDPESSRCWCTAKDEGEGEGEGEDEEENIAERIPSSSSEESASAATV